MAEWQKPDPDIWRLVLQADQGGPLFSAFQFLSNAGYPIAFLRDEVKLGRPNNFISLD